MPTYNYLCQACGLLEEKIHGIKEAPQYECPKCGAQPMKRQFTLNVAGFIIKGGTDSSHWKEKRYRMKRREEIGQRQQQHKRTGPRVRPNIAGVETGSWSDAQKMAKEAGLDHESYTPWVKSENK